MIALEKLDVSDCKSLNEYLYTDNHEAQLPINSLILRATKFPDNPVEAAIFFRDEVSPIEFAPTTNRPNYQNLNELILVTPKSNINEEYNEEDELFVNLDFGNSFVGSFNPKAKVITYRKLSNLNRQYQILLRNSKGRDIWGRGKATCIVPLNKRLENVVVTDASFVDYLPEKISKLTIPATLLEFCGHYSKADVSVDTLIVEKSTTPLIIREGGLYGLKIKNAIYNRPIIMIDSPGNSIFSGANSIIFNDNATLLCPSLGYKIKNIIFNKKAVISQNLVDRPENIIFNDDTTISGYTTCMSCYVIKDAKTLTFKKAPKIDNDALISAEIVFIPIGFNKESHWLFHNAKEMDFDSKTVVDPRLQPKDNIKIKPLKFNDPHIHNVEQAGTNRILYFQTANGKSLSDGEYYVPVSDNLYLSFSTANLDQKGKSVRLSCGPFYNLPWDILETHIMVFSYIPVENINGIEYGRTIGFYIVNPKYGEIVANFTNYATEKSNRKTPYVPPKPKKKTYHERGRIEDCGVCLGTGMGWGSASFCPFCGGKGWYIEHEW